MTELAFQFETDPQMGIPRLSAVAGTATVWSPTEVQQMEDQLRPRYETLVREGQGILQFKGNTLHIKKKDGDTTRQPTLEVRVPETVVVRTPLPARSSPAPFSTPVLIARSDWYPRWLDEIDQLVLSERLQPAELAMLKVVRDEFRGLVEKTPQRELALLLFAAVVSLADQLSRTYQPGKPQHYSFALSGIERLFDSDAATPWGQLTTTPNPDPPPSWFGRFWNLLKGE